MISSESKFEIKPKSSYPSSLMKKLRLLEMNTGGDTLQIIGSASYRDVIYPSDVDCFETIASDESREECLDFFVKRIHQIVHRYIQQKGHYFLEVKAGIDHRYDIDIGVLRGNYYVSHPELPALIHNYMSEGLMSEGDGESILGLCQRSTREAYELIKRMIRNYRVIRWNASEIARGYQTLAGHYKISLRDAINDPTSQVNIEVITVLNGRLYDMSNFFALMYVDSGDQMKAINLPQSSISDFKNYFLGGLRQSMRQLIESSLDYNPMKYVKRIYSYARFEHDESMVNKVLPILNGTLGQIYQTKSEIATILKLMDVKKDIPKRVILNQIDWIKYRLSNFPMFDLSRLDQLNVAVSGTLKKHDWVLIRELLEDLKQTLANYVNTTMTPMLVREGLLPIPVQYQG